MRLNLEKLNKPYRNIVGACERFLNEKYDDNVMIIRLYASSSRLFSFLSPYLFNTKSVIETSRAKHAPKFTDLFKVAKVLGILNTAYEKLPLDLQVPWKLYVEGNCLYDVAVFVGLSQPNNPELSKMRASQKIYKALSLIRSHIQEELK